MAVRSHTQEQPSATLLPCRTWSSSPSEISFVVGIIQDLGSGYERHCFKITHTRGAHSKVYHLLLFLTQH